MPVQAKDLETHMNNLVANDASDSGLSLALKAFKAGHRARHADHGERRTLVHIQFTVSSCYLSSFNFRYTGSI